jgi:hypothetical protein
MHPSEPPRVPGLRVDPEHVGSPEITDHERVPRERRARAHDVAGGYPYSLGPGATRSPGPSPRRASTASRRSPEIDRSLHDRQSRRISPAVVATHFDASRSTFAGEISRSNGWFRVFAESLPIVPQPPGAGELVASDESVEAPLPRLVNPANRRLVAGRRGRPEANGPAQPTGGLEGERRRKSTPSGGLLTP